MTEEKKKGDQNRKKKVNLGRILDFRFQSILLRKTLKVTSVTKCICVRVRVAFAACPDCVCASGRKDGHIYLKVEKWKTKGEKKEKEKREMDD